MTDHRSLLERASAGAPPPDLPLERILQRRDRVHRNRRIRAGVLGIAVAIAVSWWAVDAIRSTSIPANRPDVNPFARANGEVLRFIPYPNPGSPGDLVAVDPRTGQERVLLEDLGGVYSARWSADGRWLAYETGATDGFGRALWVAGGSRAPRVVATGDDYSYAGDPRAELDWMWSPTGAVLATIEHSETLRTIDAATGETTDLGGVVADLLQASGLWSWAWAPDGTRLVFASPSGATGGSLYSVDVRSGERSLLARLPGGIWKIRWSPDGTRIAVQSSASDEGRLYVMDADGSDIRLVTDDNNSLGFAWSPDGTRLAFGSAAERKVRILVATMDGAEEETSHNNGIALVEVGTAGGNACAKTSWGYNYECYPTWSPDGTQVAFRRWETGKVTVFDAAGAGEVGPLDELTFLGWDGGWYLSPSW